MTGKVFFQLIQYRRNAHKIFVLRAFHKRRLLQEKPSRVYFRVLIIKVSMTAFALHLASSLIRHVIMAYSATRHKVHVYRCRHPDENSGKALTHARIYDRMSVRMEG